MINVMRPFVFLSTILIIGSASGASGKSFDSAIGEWSWLGEGPHGAVEIGQMTIVDEMKATYSYRNGRIFFYAIYDQRKWEGYWIESTGVYNCADKMDGDTNWGTMRFQFNDTYTKWKGEFDFCGRPNKYSWDGFR